MTYFLDFDRTLFNTEAFIAHLEQRPDAERFLKRQSESALEAILGMFVRSGERVFAPEELTPFAYPDAVEFVRAKSDAVTILTFGFPEWQRRKVEAAFGERAASSALYTSNVMKGVYLKKHGDFSGDALFVDDSPSQLEDVARHFPQMSLYQMRRDGREGDGRWPVIRSLAELA